MFSSHKSVKWTVTAIAAVASMMLVSAAAQADIIHVPGDYPTIQEAIDAAMDGDEVEVHPGTYNEAIDFLGKAITVRSSDGPEVTIIDAQQTGTVVTCNGGEGPDTVLDGFTVTGGGGGLGGGMYNIASSPTVTNCTFSGNTAFGGAGGGMSNFNSSPTVTDCTFSGNTAGQGGGMSNIGSSPNVTNCTFSGNSASNVGGGMSNVNNSSPMVSNCTFIGNTADGPFSGNSADDHGGGMFNQNSSPTVTDGPFSGNSADNRGGGMFNQNSSPTVNDCTFSGNSAGDRGGGMFNDSGSPMVSNCTFIGNTADGLASFDGGGGMYNGPGSNPTVTGCAFDSNTGVFWGGAMVNANNDATVVDSLFVGNSVTGENSWGAAIANSTSPSKMIGCTFVGNTSNRQGGAIANLFGAHPTISNCVFIENTAGFDGGGMNNRDTSSPAITNSTFAGNTAGFQGGAIFINSGASPMVTNCTLAGNSAAFGGGTFSSLGTVIANSVVWDNGPDQIGGTAGDVTYSCVQGGWPGPGNIDADPLFVDPDNGDYRLMPGSPCIDAADNTAVPEDIDTDLDGNPRFVDDPETKDTGFGDPPIVDMGAYEFQGVTGVLAQLDIKPGSCPNSFNRNSHGVLPVALVGAKDFDVTEVDLSSLLLSRNDGVGGSVAPNEGPPGPHSVFADVATPFDGELCDCHDLEGDGLTDLLMKFETDDVVDVLQLNDLAAGDLVELVVSGTLLDGAPFVSSGDCLRLVGPPGDLDGDGSVGILDLLMLLAAWGTDPGGPPDFDTDGTVGILDLLTLLANWGPCA